MDHARSWDTDINHLANLLCHSWLGCGDADGFDVYRDHLDGRRTNPGIYGVHGDSAFNTPTVVHFCAVLLVAAIISAPWQALWNVSLALSLSGAGGVIFILTTVPQMRRMADYQPSLYDWLWYFAIPLVWYIAFVIAALMLPGHPATALYAIAAIMILLLFTGLHNAWDLVVYLAVERSHPEG